MVFHFGLYRLSPSDYYRSSICIIRSLYLVKIEREAGFGKLKPLSLVGSCCGLREFICEDDSSGSVYIPCTINQHVEQDTFNMQLSTPT